MNRKWKFGASSIEHLFVRVFLQDLVFVRLRAGAHTDMHPDMRPRRSLEVNVCQDTSRLSFGTGFGAAAEDVLVSYANG